MSAPDSSLEIERKYAVEAGFVLPDLSLVPGVAAVTGPDTYHLIAVYLDTPGLDLAAARITLRRRTGGTDAGWHLKLPAEAGARREVHAPLGPGGEPVPGELSGLVAEWIRGRPLRPIARLQTTRTVRRLTDDAGAPPRRGGRWRSNWPTGMPGSSTRPGGSCWRPVPGPRPAPPSSASYSIPCARNPERVTTGQAAIAAARTTGARCFRSGSWR
jgi:hypothetical protein